MPNITRWEPFRDLTSFRDDVNRLWVDALSRWPGEGWWRGNTWVPPVDVHETENEVVITAEVPGVNRENIDISVAGDTVTISGQTGEDRNEEDKTRHYHRQERYWGQFTRTVQLPVPVDAAGSAATFHDGVLRITLPKSEESRSRKIPIQEH